VISEADAIFTILEAAGLLGNAADSALAAHASDGLQPGGWRGQVTLDEPLCLPPGPACTSNDDVFALPADT
jgi:hypothetical protein